MHGQTSGLHGGLRTISHPHFTHVSPRQRNSTRQAPPLRRKASHAFGLRVLSCFICRVNVTFLETGVQAPWGWVWASQTADSRAQLLSLQAQRAFPGGVPSPVGCRITLQLRPSQGPRPRRAEPRVRAQRGQAQRDGQVHLEPLGSSLPPGPGQGASVADAMLQWPARGRGLGAPRLRSFLLCFSTAR